MKKTVFVLILTLALASLTLDARGRPGEDSFDGDTIEATVSPATIVLGSEVTWVSVHTDIALSAVASPTVTLNGVGVAWVKADARGNLVAKFRFGEIEEIVAPPTATLVLEGATKDGVPFRGTDVVTVRRIGGK